jgi:hypothetical protein
MDLKELQAACAAASGRAAELGRPVSARVLARLSQHCGVGGAWWDNVLGAWGGRLWGTPREPALLLLAALHDQALAQQTDPLARFFPTCGGAEGPDLEKAVDASLGKAGTAFFEALRLPLLRSHGAPWLSEWTIAARRLFGAAKTPFHLVHVGLGVELSLLADLCAQQADFDSALVQARLAVDRKPLDLDKAEDRRWAIACFLPEQNDTADETLHLMTRTRLRQVKDKTLVQKLAVEEELAGPLIAKNVPDEGEGLLIYTDAAAWGRSKQDYQKLDEGLAAALAARGPRAAWVDLKRDPEGRRHELVVHRVIDGQRTSVSARFYEPVAGSMKVSDLVK